MEEIIKKLLADGKGLLAADESTHTIEKRFAALGLTSTPELNKKYREMLFTTPGIEEFLAGVILFDESVRQNLQKILEEKGIVPGIKVDGGLEPFNGGEEQVTKGLEGLDARLKEYSTLGLKFSKWRAAIKISGTFPTEAFLEENLERMIGFAKISMEFGFVPIVEPEVLLDGDHTTTRCAEISVKVWKILFEKLKAANVDLKNLILKTNMVLPGKDSGVKAAPLEVAEATLQSLKESVPAEVGGIVFLSGGQTPDEATNNLNEIVKRKGDAPWPLSFSFSRALQEEVMRQWSGKDENIGSAQNIFLDRLVKVSKAREGRL
jgi:fructose-bisphosphate aldolase class I